MIKIVLLSVSGILFLGVIGFVYYNGKVDSASPAATSFSRPSRETVVVPRNEDAAEQKPISAGSQENAIVLQGESDPPRVPILTEPSLYAPDFSLMYLDGTEKFTLSDLRGEKPVVVDFFAEHCPNCRRNLPKMESLHAKYGDQVEVILIGIDSEAATRRYFRNRPTNLPIVMTNDGVLRDYQIRFTNTKALINRDGSLLGILHGQDIQERHFLDLIAR